MIKKSEQGYYYISERTNRRYELFEMKAMSGARDYTSDIYTIVDFHNSSNNLHQINFLGYSWGATLFDPDREDVTEFVDELIKNYEIEMECLIVKAVKKGDAIPFLSAEDMLSYVNKNTSKNYSDVSDMLENLFEHWYSWGDKYYYLPNDMCEFLFHIKSNF